MAPEHEVGFDHLVGPGEGPVDITCCMIALKGKIVAERGMDYGRRRIERRAHIRNRLKFIILDEDLFHRIFGRGAAGRHHGQDRFALPTDAVHRNGVLRSRLQALQVREYPNPGRDDRGKLAAGHDGNHARLALGCAGVDFSDLRMRVR